MKNGHCARCSLEIEEPNGYDPRWVRSPIHRECLEILQRLNDMILVEQMPKVLTRKEAYQAQGMAFECSLCYRLAIPMNLWKLLPESFSRCISYYEPGGEPITTCDPCYTKPRSRKILHELPVPKQQKY